MSINSPRSILRFFYPRSVLQLLVLGFLLVAMPLVALLVQTRQELVQLAAQSNLSINQAMDITANTQNIAAEALRLEHDARQYLLFGGPSLLDAYQQTREVIHSEAAQLQKAGDDALRIQMGVCLTHEADLFAQLQTVHVQRSSINKMTQGYRALSECMEDVADAADEQMGTRARELAKRVDQQRIVLTWRMAGVLPLALLLAGIFSWLISRPVQQLARGITQLSEGERVLSIGVRGPADLVYVGECLDGVCERLAQLETEKNRFLRHIAHELNTPLTAIREGVELMADEVTGRLTVTQREVVSILRDNSLSLQKQIETLLAYNATQFAAITLNVAPLQLDQLIEQLASNVRLHLTARRATLHLQLDALNIMADGDKLRVVIDNMLSNAIKYSTPGTEITLNLSRDAHFVQIDCIDTGPGVAEEDRPHVFDPFFQGSRREGGHAQSRGVGLAIVREYVALHHGRVALLPSEVGAHFRVTLPKTMILETSS